MNHLSIASRRAAIFALTVLVITACRRAKAPPPAPPPALSDSATAALAWVNANNSPFNAEDSVASANERQALTALAEGARVVGVSEMTEGAHQVNLAIRRAIFSLAETSRLRGVAIQAPM